MAAGFRLIGTPESGELTLSSPLGNALARIEWSPTQAALVTGDREVRRDSLRALTEGVLGAEVPVAAVFDWLAGVPTLSAGWVVDLSEHASGRLTALREQPVPAARLRLAFEREIATEGPE